MRDYKFFKKITGISMALMLAFTSGCGAGDASDSSNGAEEAVTEATQEISGETADTSISEEAGGDNTDIPEETEGAMVPIKLMVEQKYHGDYADDDTYTSLYSGSYDLIYLTDDCKQAYPELSKSLDAYNEQHEKEFLENHEQYLSEAKELYDSYDEKEYFGGYSDENHISVLRADDLFLSLSANVSSYFGGAHGMYGSGGYNYDVKTGKELILKDVIADIPALQKLVKEKLIEDYGEEQLGLVEDLDEAMSEYLTGEKDQTCSWFITARGIRITFGIYVLAPYAAGEQTVDVYYDDTPELFTDIFKVQTGDYIESYSYNGRYKLDIGANGTSDDVSIEPQYNDYGDIESVDIGVNGVKTSMDIYGYDLTPRFIHKGENTFLYLEMTSDNDYRNTYAFRIEEGGVVKVGEYYGYLTGNVPANYQEGEWSAYSSALLTTTEDLYFGTRMQILSTYEGIAKAVINDKGELELPDGYYSSEIYDGFGQLTAKKDVKASVIDKETREIITEDSLIKTGAVVTIIGTNSEDIVDLEDASDGTVYRVNVKSDDWPQTIDGTDIEELFDGVMFAG